MFPRLQQSSQELESAQMPALRDRSAVERMASGAQFIGESASTFSASKKRNGLLVAELGCQFLLELNHIWGGGTDSNHRNET